jgi:broad specificity phosphatase PhoE
VEVLYFIRHGESQDNVDHVWSRPYTPLTERGRQQAREAGQHARDNELTFDAIFCSPLSRARCTARLIAAELGMRTEEIEYLDLLRERDFGPLAGTRGVQLLGINNWVYRDVDNVPGVERIQAVRQRAAAALQHLRSVPKRRLLLVSHGTFGRALGRVTTDEDWTAEYASDFPANPIPNCTMTQLL